MIWQARLFCFCTVLRTCLWLLLMAEVEGRSRGKSLDLSRIVEELDLGPNGGSRRAIRGRIHQRDHKNRFRSDRTNDEFFMSGVRKSRVLPLPVAMAMANYENSVKVRGGETAKDDGHPRAPSHRNLNKPTMTSSSWKDSYKGYLLLLGFTCVVFILLVV